MSYYESFNIYNIKPQVSIDEFIILFPILDVLSKSSKIKCRRNNGTLIEGKFCNELFITWNKNCNDWLLPVKYIVNDELIIKYIYVDDLHLSGISFNYIIFIKFCLDSNIFNKNIDFPQSTTDSQIYNNFTRLTPELNPEDGIEISEPLFI